ncbi:MAG: hypothetical protein ACD_20C00082G0005 [uncultured bacterium]|nr:MAG: hypothetical protein ACD_20C00082G0005 [uncultured bacterium]
MEEYLVHMINLIVIAFTAFVIIPTIVEQTNKNLKKHH